MSNVAKLKQPPVFFDRIVVEKNVPMPPPPRNHRKYPWDEMEVGDSFFIKGSTSGKLSTAAWAAAKTRPGWKFITRKVEGGAAIWRVK